MSQSTKLSKARRRNRGQACHVVAHINLRIPYILSCISQRCSFSSVSVMFSDRFIS